MGTASRQLLAGSMCTVVQVGTTVTAKVMLMMNVSSDLQPLALGPTLSSPYFGKYFP